MSFVEHAGNSGNAANTVYPPQAGSSPAAHPSLEEGRWPPSQPAEEARYHPSSSQGGRPPASTAWGAPVPSGAAPPQGTQPDHMMPFLGMHMNHGQTYGHTDRSYDYPNKYPPDPEGKETAPEARLWKIYLDEAEIYDTDMVTGFRNTLDGTLVFAALFSSIVTGFIIEASQKLEPDYAQINASLLVENNLLLRAGGDASKIDAVKPSPLGVDSITHSWPDVLMNSMFFASLSLALVAALFSILVKQWLQVFTTVVRGDTRERCLIRQLRFTGLEKWRLPEIINALPMFLHISLALFLMGLGIFVREFHLAIRIVVNGIACATAAVYFTTLILPAIHIDCPYRLPILRVPAAFIVHLFKQILQVARRRPCLRFQSSPFFSQEREFALNSDFRLMARCISWLFTESTNNSVQRASVHAAAGLIEGHGAYRYWSFKAAGTYLPVTEMLLFVLNSGDTLQSTLEEQSPLVRSLAKLLRQRLQGPSTDVWNMAFGSHALLDLFLQERVNIDEPYSWDGLTAYAFQHACRKRYWHTAIQLLPHACHLHFTAFGDFGETPLMLVCQARSIDEEQRLYLVNGLLASGAKVGDVDKGGENALHHAIDQHKYPSLKVLDLLLSYASPNVINQQDSLNTTPLHKASLYCPPSHIHALLKAGADANTLDLSGKLPLDKVCFRIGSFVEPSDFEVFKSLVEATNPATLVAPMTSLRVSKNRPTALDALVDRRHYHNEATFAKAYKLMRAKGAQCNRRNDRQVEIDAELGVTTAEE